MDYQGLCRVIARISQKIDANREYLIELDQQNGDGDLGVSMCEGFRAVCDYLNATKERDLGRLLNKAGDCFNEAAPSSLGTILSFGFKGMAVNLRGKQEATLAEIADALQSGLDRIMQRAGSKPGEKTILDALCPGVEALLRHAGEDIGTAAAEAAKAARAGSESTRTMKAVWGRAAYYGDASIGVLDGGSVVGALVFEGLADFTA